MLKKDTIRLITGLLICLGVGLFLISQIKFNKDRDKSSINCTLTSDLEIKL